MATVKRVKVIIYKFSVTQHGLLAWLGCNNFQKKIIKQDLPSPGSQPSLILLGFSLVLEFYFLLNFAACFILLPAKFASCLILLIA